MASQFGSYVRARKDLGKSVEDLQMSLQCMTHCAPTMEEALNQLPYIRWQIRAQKALTSKRVINGKTQAEPYEGEMAQDIFLDRTYLGDPESLIKKFKRANDIGITNISLWMDWGGIEHEKLMRSIKLFGEEVLPVLKDLNPPQSAVAEVMGLDEVEGTFTVTGDRLSADGG